MELLNPLMLWGGLAIAIPIIIHFWHQKKGKVLAWAATQWLLEKNLQQSRGIRLDNILLLLLRCLLLLLLCFLLSKPVFDWSDASSSSQKIHLVQPNKLIIDNFKFELQDALKKGEKIYWIQPALTLANDLGNVPQTDNFNPLLLQSCLNKLAQTIKKEDIALYLINSQNLAQVPKIFVPSAFNLHTIVDSSKNNLKPYLAFDNKKLFVNAANQLALQAESDNNNTYTGSPANNAPIEVLILNQNKAEKQTILASLKALEEVYKITLTADTEVNKHKKYNWVFSDKPLISKSEYDSESTLNIISNTDNIPANQLRYQKNTIQIPYILNPQTSAAIFNGEFPEWLAETLIKHYDLNPIPTVLSNQQLQSIFTKSGAVNANQENELARILLFAFIIILGIERYIAITKNA
ncbi:BatA domain-containing protein [Emticicia sp. 21SJ11W-3]|uniref:BatA domain-containing protein n=1 Tax=Emticicia sp. 21SJ11W-3 TaxID=2916755 RepID=UPI0020A155AA|nr:BatA domain-containing protein [Emticicia sp. 21SJ11W-3]UTA69486.1 BatA domain-containing protein [Emticicia sp. 21SJ11W-3]